MSGFRLITCDDGINMYVIKAIEVWNVSNIMIRDDRYGGSDKHNLINLKGSSNERIPGFRMMHMPNL